MYICIYTYTHTHMNCEPQNWTSSNFSHARRAPASFPRSCPGATACTYRQWKFPKVETTPEIWMVKKVENWGVPPNFMDTSVQAFLLKWLGPS